MELSSEFWWFILIGLGAQLVDGALGMAFGLVSSSVMLSMGLPPAQVSASIHTAEVFTTGASGVSHLAAGNVDKRLFLRLALPARWAVPWARTCSRRFRRDHPATDLPVPAGAGDHHPGPRGRTLDAQGRDPPGTGAGLLRGPARRQRRWRLGPIATSTLLARGGQARTTIGTVNAAEFVVTLTVSATFLLSMGVQHLQIVAGLLIGGMMAAPVAAILVKRVQERWVLVAVGVLVLGISLFQVGHAVYGYLGH